MKKLVTILLAATMVVGVCGIFAGCTDDDDTYNGETVEISCLDGSAQSIKKEVPYNPRRVAILDYAVLDMMDIYGVGDRVVSSARGTLAYLQTYWDKMDENEIVDLGNLQNYSTELLQQSEPDIIFIGGRQSKAYAELEQIAPVVYLSVTAGNIVEETFANAKTVATIFGVSDERVTEVENDLRPRIATLRALSGVDDGAAKTALVLMYNSEKSISALASDGRCSLISSELGFALQAATASEGGGGNHGSSVSWETIIDVNPDYIFVLNRGYITSNGEDGNAAVVETFNNNLINNIDAEIIVMDNPDAWYTAEGGVQALAAMVSDLEKAFGIDS